jgi:hypothetical protein
MIQRLPATLFPHSRLPEFELKKILSLFGPLRIFTPWFREPPSLETINLDSDTVDIKNPPKEMKPGEDFRSLLLEYARWIRDNQDKGYTEFLKAGQEAGLSERTTWEIRRMIRGGKEGDRSEYETLRWHLILHLAQDMEDQRREADRMLASLKEKDILFKGIIEESEDVQNLLEDLPSFESDSIMPENHSKHILEAWFALFGVYLRKGDLLLTLNRHFMEYVHERWSQQFMDYADELWKRPENENQVDGIPSLRFDFPDFSRLPLEERHEINRTSSDDDTVGELKDLLLNFGDDPVHNLPKLEKLTANLERSYHRVKTENTLKITFKYLPPFPDAGKHESESLPTYLGNRMFILMED